MSYLRSTPFVIEEEGVPLQLWDDGSVRVGGTRGTLDVIIGAYNGGESISEIAENYGQLPVEVVAAIAGYYERHRDAVDAYIDEGTRIGEYWRAKIEALPGQAEFMDRMRGRVATYRAAQLERNARPTH